MIRRVTMAAAAALLLLAPAAHADLVTYDQDFEALVQADPQALGNNGWKVFANVFSPDHSAYYYGYGVFPAPNNSGGFCGIDLAGGGAQGTQDMVVYSDYNNGDHANGNQIEANVFQEQVIGAGDVGSTWVFQFDAKKGNLESPTTALAFIKTLNPAWGYATTNFITLDTTNLAGDWAAYTLTFTVNDPILVGQILQFGFSSTAGNYKGSGVFYDNVKFRKDGSVDARRHSWGELKTRFR